MDKTAHTDTKQDNQVNHWFKNSLSDSKKNVIEIIKNNNVIKALQTNVKFDICGLTNTICSISIANKTTSNLTIYSREIIKDAVVFFFLYKKKNTTRKKNTILCSNLLGKT
ncbi:MAG: hypothetical protein KBC27_02290 [Rickettsiales bacterium]|nr:hypothetical protein [Rickettsiales bacterium]